MGFVDTTANTMIATPSSLFDTPLFLASAGGLLYVTEAGTHPAVRAVDVATGRVSTVAGGSCVATRAGFTYTDCSYAVLSGPTGIGITTDSSGNNVVLFADGGYSSTSLSSSAVAVLLRITSQILPLSDPVLPVLGANSSVFV
jgi:hypothetical protein